MSAPASGWLKYPRLLAAGETVAGRVLVWACAALLFWWHEVTVLMPLAVAAATIAPARRRPIAALAAAAAVCEYFIRRNDADIGTLLSAPGAWLRPFVLIVGVVAGLFVLYRLARHFAAWPSLARRFPVLTLHAGFWAALALVGPVPAVGIVTELGPWLIWRLSYMVQLASRGRFANTTFADNLLYLWPVFGGNTPFGKGFEYLSRREAADPVALTQAQLSGVKILLLAGAWQGAIVLLDAFALGGGRAVLPPALAEYAPERGIAIARVSDAIGGAPVTTAAAWMSIYVELVRATLVVAVRGHIVVGCLRLLGFNVFRNTYKPLLAESILEFWNRFSYYFKELMVEFFFYPVFLRNQWAGPRLRLFLAVFAAAFVGNMYFHLLLHPARIAAGDVGGLWALLGARSVYCFFLAAGVWISMLRQQRQRREQSPRRWPARLRAIAGVWTFYAIIHVWNVRAPGASLADRAEFCLRLIGLH